MTREHIPVALQRRVRERARDRCEYCLLAQRAQEATFHVDHVRPRREGGQTALENLALACVSCSLRKGARLDAEDPETRERVALFNPRWNHWEDHFKLVHLVLIQGKTPSGRATVALLKLNRPLVVSIREEEAAMGRYP